MVRFIQIYKVTAAVMASVVLFLSSCDRSAPEVNLSVTAQYESVSAKAGQMFITVKCNSSWKAEVTDNYSGGPVDWARLNVTSGDSDRNIILSYDANTDETASRTLKITVSSSGLVMQVSVEQTPAGERPEPEIDPDEPVAGGNLSASSGWMELPAMDNPALGYYFHNFEMNGKTYRNYSFGWSQEDLVAIWMAYPLCGMYTNKNVSRTDDWDYDPILGTEYSSAPFGGYGGSYARGHQVPSADRLCCYEANAQTFYGTNMTPQLNAHNGGIWMDLENKVRNIANASDTTYVVTGVIVEDSDIFTVDSDGKKMTVPTAYFKALLRYSKSSTLGVWNATAFYHEHRGYSMVEDPETEKKYYDHKSCSMSIDELEEITGIDFFVNLPAKVGEDQAARIEAADPADSSIWW